MKKMSKMCEEYKKSVDEAVVKYGKAILENNAAAMATAENEAKDAAENYNSQSEKDLFSAHKDDADFVFGVLKDGFYETIKIKKVSDNGIPSGLEAVPSEAQVNIRRMFTYGRNIGKIPQKTSVEGYQERAMVFTASLVERGHENLGRSTEGVRDRVKMSKKARAMDIPADRTSNTSLLKALQHTIDAIIFKDDGNGNNAYKANSFDLKYVMMCFTSMGLGRLDVKSAGWQKVVNLVMRVIYKIANNAQYEFKFKEAKDSDFDHKRAFKAKESHEGTTADAPADVTLPAPTTEDAA